MAYKDYEFTLGMLKIEKCFKHASTVKLVIICTCMIYTVMQIMLTCQDLIHVGSD